MGDFFSVLILIVYGLSTGGVLCLLTSYFVQLRRHCELLPAGRAEEERRLAIPLAGPQELPHVVVQVVSYNEGALVRRAMQSVVLLDWPKDRLHIQILDDSTDDTLAQARAMAADLQAAGFDIVVLHRERRENFKAGALAEGMAASPHEYFAIFDTDYVPRPDFLRRCMPALLADAKHAFVQARIDYLNPEENSLTQAQALMLDHHMAVDQMTRCWAGHPLPFNGTCGIWRRAAIEAAGGWRGDTLAEDLDLSYRAWMKGYGGYFVSSVAVPGELPDTLEAWTNQQYRWTTGFGQVAWRVLPLLASARVPEFRRKVSAFRHLSPAIVGPFVTAANLSLLVLLLLQPAWALPLLVSIGVLFLLGLIALTLGLAIGQLTVRGALPPRKFAIRCLHVMALQLLVAWLMTYRSIRKAIGHKRQEFVRTPKRGGLPDREPHRLT